MNRPRKYFHVLAFCLTFSLVNTAGINAQGSTANFISETLPDLKQISTDLNMNALALLAIIREYEKYGAVNTSKVVRVIKPASPVRETDNLNSRTILEARQNDEFVVTDEHDKWYKIRTQDSREGWIAEEDIQMLNKQLPVNTYSNKGSSQQEASVLLEQMNRYKKSVDELYSRAIIIVKKTEEGYNNLSKEYKVNLEPDYRLFTEYKERIEKSIGYVRRFSSQYESLLIATDAAKPVKVASVKRFKGTASGDVGRSSYENMNSNSTTSSRFGFNGIYEIDKSARANIAFNHRKELMQTVFTDNVVEAGLSKQFADKFTMSSNLGYNDYNDKATDNNSFQLFSASVNTAYTPSRKARIFGNANFQSKSFKAAGDENYKGVIYVFGTNFAVGSGNNIRLQVQGNKQSSEKDFLKFSQLRPQFNYLHKKNLEKSFGIGLEYDVLQFAETNNFNDYHKYRADFQWRKNLKKNAESRNLILTYKQYPNNSKQDYFKLESSFESRTGSYMDERSSINSFSYLFNIITERKDNFLTDYLDVRWDRANIRPRSYSNGSIYTRIWNNFKKMVKDSVAVPDHFIDFYSEFGPYFRSNKTGSVKISSIKFGFIFGGHLFFNFDNDYFVRNGNSARVGFALGSNLKIYRADLVFAGSYEWSFILSQKTTYDSFSGNIIYGDNLIRRPTSLQLNIDYRQPISTSWDFHLNLSNYNIRTDATTETSINPIKRKSNMRFTGGLIYRFAI